MSSTSLAKVCHSIFPRALQPTHHLRPCRTMAACVANSRTETRLLSSSSPSPSPSSPSSSTQIGTCLCSYVDHSQPRFTDYVLHPAGDTDEDVDGVWAELRREAQLDLEKEPILENYYRSSVLSHPSLESALANHLANKLGSPNLISTSIMQELFMAAFAEDPAIGQAIREDLRAARDRDPACSSMVHCLLYYKGFLACQAHRVAHRLWTSARKVLAVFIQSRVSEVFAVDIHPGARIGSGILLDHATGLVIGETAVIGDNVSILHNVTLGGTGKDSGNRHPKIGDGVLVGAGTHILGNVSIGEGSKIGAGSVVLKEVPPRTTAVGNPAKLIGGEENPVKLDKMPSFTMDHTSWSDYVI